MYDFSALYTHPAPSGWSGGLLDQQCCSPHSCSVLCRWPGPEWSVQWCSGWAIGGDGQELESCRLWSRTQWGAGSHRQYTAERPNSPWLRLRPLCSLLHPDQEELRTGIKYTVSCHSLLSRRTVFGDIILHTHHTPVGYNVCCPLLPCLMQRRYRCHRQTPGSV